MYIHSANIYIYYMKTNNFNYFNIFLNVNR